MSARTAAGRSGGLDDNYWSKMPSTNENLNAPRGGDGLPRDSGGRGRGQGRKAGSRNDDIPRLRKEWVAMLEKLRKELPAEDGRRARDGARSSGTSGKPDESDDYRRMYRRPERPDQLDREPKQRNSMSYSSAYHLFSADNWLRDDDDDDDDADELNDVIDRLLLEREEKMRAEKRQRRAEDIIRRLEEVMQKKSDSVVHTKPIDPADLMVLRQQIRIQGVIGKLAMDKGKSHSSRFNLTKIMIGLSEEMQQAYVNMLHHRDKNPYDSESYQCDHMLPIDLVNMECRYARVVVFHCSNIDPTSAARNRAKGKKIIYFQVFDDSSMEWNYLCEDEDGGDLVWVPYSELGSRGLHPIEVWILHKDDWDLYVGCGGDVEAAKKEIESRARIVLKGLPNAPRNFEEYDKQRHSPVLFADIEGGREDAVPLFCPEFADLDQYIESANRGYIDPEGELLFDKTDGDVDSEMEARAAKKTCKMEARAAEKKRKMQAYREAYSAHQAQFGGYGYDHTVFGSKYDHGAEDDHDRPPPPQYDHTAFDD